MAEAIVNKVANSVLVNFDLEEYIPMGTRTFIDLSQWLEQGFLLREKPFREALKKHDWNTYSEHFVALGCSSRCHTSCLGYTIGDILFKFCQDGSFGFLTRFRATVVPPNAF